MADELDLVKEQLASLATGPDAAIRTESDGDNGLILGNRAGFLRLAILALEAAQGDNIQFKNHAWIEEEGWRITGFTYVEAIAQPQLDPPFWRSPQQIFGWLFVSAIAGIFLLGLLSALGTVRHWIFG